MKCPSCTISRKNNSSVQSSAVIIVGEICHISEYEYCATARSRFARFISKTQEIGLEERRKNWILLNEMTALRLKQNSKILEAA